MRFRLRSLFDEGSEQRLRESILLVAAFRVPLHAHHKSSGFIFERLNDAIRSRGYSLKIFSHLPGRLVMKTVHFNQIVAGQPFEKTAFG